MLVGCTLGANVYADYQQMGQLRGLRKNFGKWTNREKVLLTRVQNRVEDSARKVFKYGMVSLYIYVTAIALRRFGGKFEFTQFFAKHLATSSGDRFLFSNRIILFTVIVHLKFNFPLNMFQIHN